MKLSGKTTLLVASGLLATGIVGFALGVVALTGTSGTITITALPGLTIVSASVSPGGATCVVTSTTFTCPSTSLQQGASETISVRVSNPAQVLAQTIPPPAYVYSSCACASSAYLTTTALGVFPYVLAAGQQVTFQFVVTAVAAGSDSVSITI